MRPVFLTSLLLLLAATASAEEQDAKTYSGLYFYNFEFASLFPDGSKERWCISGDMSDAEIKPTNGKKPWGTARVTVLGTLGPEGKYGNLGACSHVLKVLKILTISDKKSEV